MEIRDVVFGDLEQLYNLWAMLANYEGSQSDYPDVDPMDNQDRWLHDVSKTMLSTTGRILVADDGGLLIGYMKSGVMERAIGHPRFYLQVSEMYVMPEYRKGPAARRLRNETIRWVNEIGADVVDMVELVCVYTDKQINRWVKKGYKPYAVTMRKEL